ncbi:MAG: hypothetical protein ISS82_05020 [Nanoarchaeota archaeon]|nr:hypothetical protein [Nanoarchaeota archaeon]
MLSRIERVYKILEENLKSYIDNFDKEKRMRASKLRESVLRPLVILKKLFKEERWGDTNTLNKLSMKLEETLGYSTFDNKNRFEINKSMDEIKNIIERGRRVAA